MKQMATLAMRCMAEVAGRGEIAERCDEVRLSDVIHLSECPRDSEVAELTAAHQDFLATSQLLSLTANTQRNLSDERSYARVASVSFGFCRSLWSLRLQSIKRLDSAQSTGTFTQCRLHY